MNFIHIVFPDKKSVPVLLTSQSRKKYLPSSFPMAPYTVFFARAAKYTTVAVKKPEFVFEALKTPRVNIRLEGATPPRVLHTLEDWFRKPVAEKKAMEKIFMR